MKKIYITRQIPEIGITMLRDKGYEIKINDKARPLTKDELITVLKGDTYDAALTLLTDQIDAEVMDASPSTKIFANLATGFNNFNIEAAQQRGVFLTNTPGGGSDRVAEHTMGLILALACRIVEGDSFMRRGEYKGWDPMLLLGTELSGKTLGIIGTGKIGAGVVHRASKGFMMKVAYYDIKRNDELEKTYGATYYEKIEDILSISDIVSLHVPLIPQTHHLINADRLRLMKKTAFLVNTSRGPVVDEVALVAALKGGMLAGAGLDVFEDEPHMARGLADLQTVVLTPHIASATRESRNDMAVRAAQNIIDYFETGKPRDLVYN